MIALKNTTDKQIFYILKKSTRGFHPYFDLTSLSVEYTENGQYSILPPTGYDGLSKVNVTVDVAGSCNLTTSTATITEGGIHTITPPSGYDGFTEVTVDTSNVYDNGKQDGIDEQKSKLTSGSFTENGTYNREDGWNAVTVNVDTQTPYDNGFADGEDAQKAKLSSLNVIANGTYSREDGWNEVIVNVESGEVTKTVQDLIDEGYARVVTGDYGNYIEILDTCPYTFNQVIDVAKVARNEKQLTEGTNNIIVWNQTLPDGWSQSDIKSIYEGETLNFDPRGEMLWALYDVDSLNITFAGGRYQASDYPWGSYHSEGIFAPRYNIPKEAEYAQKGWRNTPRNVNVTFTGNYSSVSQVSFTQMKTTENLTLNTQVYSCQDTTGMFEGCTGLKNLVINGEFHWDTWRLCHNVFDGCNSLTSIPYTTEWNRTDAGNIIYPRFDGVRGSANCRHLFNAPALESIGPVLNMNAISLNGCTADGQTQAALSDALFHCPVLTDVRIINLNNNDWDFTDENGSVYIPLMDATSAEYLLNNVADVTSQGGHTVTLPANGTISSTAIANAESKGWTVVLVDAPSCLPDLSVIGWTTEDIQPIQNNINNYTSYTTARSITGSDVIFLPMMDFSSNPTVYFYNNKRLVAIPKWDTSNVTSMNDWFDGCTALLTIPQLDTSNVTDMNSMFTKSGIKSIPILDTSNVTTMVSMFSYTENLTTIPQLDTSSVTNMNAMFLNSNIQSVPPLDLSSCTTAREIFEGCDHLTSFPKLMNTSNLAGLSGMMFKGCYSAVGTIDLFDTSGITEFSSMFYNCARMTSVPAFDTSSATTMFDMFYGCSSLTTVPELDCSNVTTISGMFEGCSALTDVGGLRNLGNAYTSDKVSDLDLTSCTALTSASTHNILTKLGDISSTGRNVYVAFDSSIYSQLDPDDISSATAKGWAVIAR